MKRFKLFFAAVVLVVPIAAALPANAGPVDEIGECASDAFWAHDPVAAASCPFATDLWDDISLCLTGILDGQGLSYCPPFE